MSEIWDGLSRKTFVGSGRLICGHNNEWQCDIWLAQLFNGCVVIQVSNVEKAFADLDRRLKRHELFRLVGTLNDGQDLTAESIHFSWRFHQGVSETLQGLVHRPGFVETTNLDNIGMSFQSVTCEVTNLFFNYPVEPIDIGQVKIRLDWLPDRNDNRQRMEALKTTGILSSISIDPLEQMPEDQVGDLMRALCGLLTFAQRAPVHCVAQHWKDENGTILRSRYQEPVFYSPTIFRPLIPAKSLATFILGTFENYMRQWETWDLGHAIDHYVQGMSLRSSWSQAVGFFTALETLKNAFLQRPGNDKYAYYESPGKAFDKEFKRKKIASQVRELLADNLEGFKDLSDEDKSSLSLKIKNDLNRRAYKLVLREMFRELTVTLDDDDYNRLVKLRDQITHTGSPDYGKSPWKEPSEAALEAARFAGLVERTILAILNYQGDFERYDQIVSTPSP